MKSKLVIDKDNKKFKYFVQLNKNIRLPLEFNTKYREHRDIESINFSNVIVGYKKNRISIM